MVGRSGSTALASLVSKPGSHLKRLDISMNMHTLDEEAMVVLAYGLAKGITLTTLDLSYTDLPLVDIYGEIDVNFYGEFQQDKKLRGWSALIGSFPKIIFLDNINLEGNQL